MYVTYTGVALLEMSQSSDCDGKVFHYLVFIIVWFVLYFVLKMTDEDYKKFDIIFGMDEYNMM